MFERGVWSYGAVIGVETRVVLGVFEPATRLEAADDFGIEPGPVFDGTHHQTDMDVVERVIRVCPWELAVFEFEFAVGRHPGGLGGGDVGTDDFG